MEQNISNSTLDDIQNNVLTPQSLCILNEEGMKLLQDTIESVRVAITKINVFKYYLMDQIKTNLISKSESSFKSSCNEGNEKIDVDMNVSHHTLNSITAFPQSIKDVNLQVFFTILDNKITELAVREAFEKEGFEDFVVTIKNKLTHSYGFIKFSTEEAVCRAVQLNLKILVNGELIKIRPHKSVKSMSTILVPHNQDNVSKEIDEGLLINVSSGYQNSSILNNYVEALNDLLEKNSDEQSCNEFSKIVYHASETNTSEMSKTEFFELPDNRKHKFTYPSRGSYSCKNKIEINSQRNRNSSNSKPFKHISEKNRLTSKNKDKYFISKRNLSKKKNISFKQYSSVRMENKQGNKGGKN